MSVKPWFLIFLIIVFVFAMTEGLDSMSIYLEERAIEFAKRIDEILRG